MFLLNGQILRTDTPFTHNGVQYPANWLNLSTPEEKTALGITEVTQQARPDDRFYWVTELSDGTYNTTPKQLHDDKANNAIGLITNWTNTINDTANKMLQPTDWMIIRKAERNINVDANTTSYRANVISYCNTLVSEVANTSTVDQLVTIITTQNWPKV